MDNGDLIIELANFEHDPLGFVLFAFPWGEPGELENKCIEEWQVEILSDLGTGLIDYTGAIRLARTSGHGIGKSALVSWLILWAMSTMENTVGVVTANTETQLKTKTWVQLAKWYRMFIGRQLFKLTATAMFSVDPDNEKTWRFDMVPWSERNTEAFAGLHNQGRRIVVVFDEASAIPDVIWEVTEGALTDANTQIIWAVFGNPTRAAGRFRACFAGGQFEHRWAHKAIDSREVSFTDKKQIEEWVKDYGVDSDFVRIRVRGVFPRVDAQSFISFDIALEATQREVEPQLQWPIVLGVDVARFGDDCSVIYPRQGRDARSYPPEVYRGLDTMTLAGKVAQAANKYKAVAVFVDGGGVGGGVVDRLRQLRVPVHEVQFGGSADGFNELDPETKYANKRSEIWGALRDWLITGAIPSKIAGMDADATLPDEFSGPTYGLNTKDEILLEPKQSMRKRGVRSPDIADALACTFAYPVYVANRMDQEADKPVVLDDYNPYSEERMHA